MNKVQVAVWFELWYHRIKRCDQLLHHKKPCHKVWMIPLYAMTPLMLYKVYVSFISGSSQDIAISSWLILMAPFDGESISFSTKSTILVIGLLRVWLPLCESATQSVTLRTSPFLSASTPIILANGHWLCRQSCSFNITCHQLQNSSFHHSIFVWSVNFAEILFFICAKTPLQYAARVSIFF